MTLAVGSRLGPYEITAKLGEGGMGEVWRATDSRLKREVAIKVLPAAFTEDGDRLARFEREAQVLAQLHHPNVASIFGLEESNGVRALVLELVEGDDLSALVARGPLAVPEALAIARQIAEALETAHEKGIVHRDLKPANVKVRRDGAVKVLDFGLAKATDPARGGASGAISQAPTRADAAARSSEGTQAGAILGTAAYMAPEQARGTAVDARADVWAFGVVLFEMVSGRRPFTGSTLSAVLAGVLGAEPDWGALPSGLPPAVRTLLARCLTRDPRRRLQSIGEARIAIEDALSGGALPAPDPIERVGGTRRRERAAWALAAVALLGLGATLLLLGPGPASRQTSRTTSRFTIAPPGAGFENGIALSRDGSRLAFAAPGPGGEDLVWLRPLSEVEARPIAGTEGASFPFWSPDGDRLAFFAKGKLKTVELADGRVQSLCAAPTPRGGCWSPQGTLLLSIHAGGTLVSVPAGGGTPTAVIEPTDDVDAGTFRFPSFLPDGRRFLCYRFGGAARHGLWLGAIGSKELTFLVEADSGGLFAPPDRLVYRSHERLVAQPFELAGAKVTGPAVPLADDPWSDPIATMQTAFDVSETGVLAYRTGGPARSRLLWFDRSGAPLGAIGPEGSYIEPTLSPDGRRLAVSRGNEDGRTSDIWVFEADREAATRFSFGSAGSNSTPLWSPDGRYLAWASFPSGLVIRKAASGAGPEETLWKNPSFWPLSDWSRDGRHLLFEVLEFRRFRFDVGRVAFEGNHALEPLLTGAFSELGARLSPDGRWLAYFSDESGVEEVFVRSYPDLEERWQVSTAGGTQPRWRGDGRELYFVAPDRRIMAVSVRTEPRFEAGPPRALFRTRILPPVEARNHYDVTPDGARFVVNSRPPDDATAPIVVVLGWTAGLERR